MRQTIYIAYGDMGWVVRMKFYATGEYKLNLRKARRRFRPAFLTTYSAKISHFEFSADPVYFSTHPIPWIVFLGTMAPQFG